MTAKTIDLEKFENIAGNLFKGILMISKRSRQINDKYVASEVHDLEDFNEEEIGELIPDEDYVAKPKPQIVAFEEYNEDKIKILDKDF